MAEPNKQQIGDGADNYGSAVNNAAKAAKQATKAGKEVAKQAAAKGAEATANAAAATVKAGVEGGKAVAEIAAGTASGGPWGAIISAAWAMRHTLFKILVCICLCVVFLIVLIVELPGILINRALGLDGSQPTEQVTIVTVFETVTDVISNIIGLGYDSSMTQVETLIADGGYDYDLSMNALVNHAQSSAGYDVAYIMSAYSTSVDQLSATQTDLEAKLSGVSGNMFPVTSVEKENEVITPVTYYTYKPVTMTVVTRIVQAGYYIKHGIANYNEDLFYMSVFITISAKTYEELMWRKQQMVDMLKSMDMYVSDCRFQQETALRSVMPFLKIAPSLEKKAKRNVLTSGAASTYMFTSYELSDDTGVLLGINRHNNSLCIVDLFNTKRNKNANLNLIGTSGAGKTFTLQLLALRMRMRGIQCFILAPIKGHEFRRACNAVGGQFIRIAPGSPHCINIMEIRHTIAPEMELIDAMDYVELGSMLANKIQQLMIFFSLLIPDMTNEEEQLLDEALIKTYADFGITHDNESVYEDATVTPPKMKQMPILGDLHKHLLENKMTERIAVIVSRFVTGSAQSFNRQTNVDLSNKYIVFDLSELKGKLLPVGMMIALDYVWDSVKKDLTKKKAVMIDEIWKLVGTSSNKQAAEFCLTIFKTIRGFGGAAVSATQDLSDFFGLEDGKYGRAIINNSKNKIILNLEPDEAKYVQDVLKLTKTEVQSITRFERGEALIYSNNNKVPVLVKASKAEHEMITTDRAELEAILRQRQKEHTHSE